MKLLSFLPLLTIWQLTTAQTNAGADSLIQVFTGKVTTLQGTPVAGANVTTRTGKGTTTNAQGVFTLAQLKNSDMIMISHIGYITQRLHIQGRQTITVTLQPASNQLDAVVVQGYGVTTERLATGNISKVTAADIAKQPVTNPLQILQGRVPGASLTNVSGHGSAPVKIEVRGRNTIDPRMVAEPLYIIDGVPLTTLNLSKIETMAAGSAVGQGAIQSGIASPAGGQSPLFNLNPADIESIEVLKDADATAIYGARGSNGVILVTTKKGKAGSTVTELNAYTGFSKVTRFYDLLTTSQYVSLRKTALANDGLPINMLTAPDLVAWDTTRYTNWQKFAFDKTARVINSQLSITGGNEYTNFRASASYLYQEDIATVRGGNKRGSFSLSLQHKTPDRKLTLSLSAQYSASASELAFLGNTLLLPPNAPSVYDNNGRLNYAGWAPLSGNYPYGSLLQPYSAKTNLLTSNLTLQYHFSRALTARINLGYNNSVNEQEHMIPIASQNPDINPKGTLNLGRSLFHNVITEPQVEYSTFVGGGKLTVLVGSTLQSNVTEGVLNVGTNYANDLVLHSINAAPNKAIIHNKGEYKYAGLFSRISYNWRNRYILNLNGRRDGSSRFGRGQQFGNFGSVGAAWIITEAPWLRKPDWLTFGKLRMSYGITGSDQIGDYGYLSLWDFGTAGKYGNHIPLLPTRFADSLLHWEENRKMEIGLQVGFWNDRINLQASWYRNRCNNQLVTQPIALQTGFGTVTTNSPANVQNTGMEFTATVQAIAGPNWQLTTRFNTAINRNKLLGYPNFEQSPYKSRYVIGMPLNIQKLLHNSGVDPATGLYQFTDRTKDGNITIDLTGMTADDRVPIDMTPVFEGGWSTDLTYRQWSLSIFWFFRKQKGFNALVMAEQPGSRTNQPTSVLDYWKKSGDQVSIGKPTTQSTTNVNHYAYYSDARISDASFIRLQNLAVGWQLPDRLLSKWHLRGLKLYVQGENLWLITGYKGSDPEIQQFGSLPRPSVLTAGLTCTF